MDYKALLERYAGHFGTCEAPRIFVYADFQARCAGEFGDDEILLMYLSNGQTEDAYYRDRDDWFEYMDSHD